MFTKILFRSVAGTTALGSALAVSLIAGPGTVTASPEIRNVACEYPAAASSETALTLLNSMGRFGDVNRATVQVTSGNTTPAGQVQFAINGNTRATRPLSANGTATFGLPGYLPAKTTHSVTATFVPADACAVEGSSDSSSYTVFRRGTKATAAAPDRVRGKRPVVRVSVDSGLPRDARGKVRVVLRRGGKIRANRVVRLSDGSAVVRFRKMRVGDYKVRVRYLGARNFKRSTNVTTFGVQRPV